MSSTSPYKSKLFNFLNRQSIHWNSRLVQAARRLKISLEWGAQIAVYPLYLLVQSGRVAARQLGAVRSQRRTEVLAIAPPMAVDEPIKQLTSTSPEANTQVLRGIACDMASQNIVFVDPHNQLIAPQQSQTTLRKQISFHLSNFYYQQRQRQQAAIAPREPGILPPIQTHNPTLIAPMRWLLQGISWIEHSPVAIAIDLFGESRWHTALVPPEIYAPNLLPPLQPLLAPIDATVAALEINIIEPTRKQSNLFQRFLTTFLTPPMPTHSTALDPAMDILPKAGLVMFELPEAIPLTDHTPSCLSPEPITHEPIVSLAAVPPIINLETIPDGRSPLLPTENIIPATNHPNSGDLTLIEPEPPNTEIEAQPIWIETPALIVGYEKHFLERLLKKIDQILAWIENTIAYLVAKFK